MRKLTFTIAVLFAFALVGPVQSADAQTTQGTWNCVSCETTGGCTQSCSPNFPFQPIIHGHTANTDDNGTLANPHTFCVCSVCGYPECGVAANEQESDEVYAMLDHAVRGEFQPVLDLVERFPEVAVLNLDRNHLQVNSPCDEGKVVASIPLTAQQVAAVYSRQPGISTLASR